MLKLKGIKKTYISKQKKTNALEDISISFRDNEFVCITGPSGCGKTTLLNIIGGLDRASYGDITINNVPTKHYKEKDWDKYRNQSIGFVFQNYNLIPHLTVYDNIELALILSDITSQEKNNKINKVLDQVSLKTEAYKYPNQLSGGQMQRVAIARALVNNPDIILADEPTGALDSKTAIQIVKILKEIANEKLVIMVTHNEKLSDEYATREIKLLDGRVIKDSNPYEIEKYDSKPIKKQKKFMNLFTTLKLSFKSLITKKLRSLLVIMSGSVGIIGVTLILTISGGIDRYINDLQRVTLEDSPIYISPIYDSSDPDAESTNYEPFPEQDFINIVTDRSYYSHMNIFSEEFVNHLETMDKSLYNVIDFSRTITMNLVSENNGVNSNISSYRFTEMEDDLFIKQQYKLLAGKMPENKSQVILLVDRYNNIKAQTLNDLGIPYEDVEKYSYNDLLGKTYKIILNNEMYNKDENGLYSRKAISQIDLAKSLEIEIVGIVRIDKEAQLNLYSEGILYTKALGDYLIDNARESNIVIDQLEYGLNKNVYNGQPFEDRISPSTRLTKEYLYESQLVSLGYKSSIGAIKIYTDKFDSRIRINKYLADYNQPGQIDQNIRYSDPFSNIIKEFNSFVQVLTRVLIVFALVSLLVSSIMISVMTYVSVMERMKEIGILRSLGASRFDIANIFNSETAIIGFSSGVLGIVISFILMNPILRMIMNILENNNVDIFPIDEMNINLTNPLFIIFIILGSTIITIISGIIPAIIGASKSPVDAIRNE
jgi:putative ABC transport system permease protein